MKNLHKENYVKETFGRIAEHYDYINKVISWGRIGKWRMKLVEFAEPPEDGRALDLGSGTGEVALSLANRMPKGEVIGVDFCPPMIEIAKQKLKASHKKNIKFILGNGMGLDFPSNYFHLATCAFALRNMEDVHQVLSEMKRVVKPGGQVLSLDLAKPKSRIFRTLYFAYFNHLLPLIGSLIHGSREPYQYLTDSLRHFPNQDSLKDIYIQVGLKKVQYLELSNGIVAIHKGEK